MNMKWIVVSEGVFSFIQMKDQLIYNGKTENYIFVFK